MFSFANYTKENYTEACAGFAESKESAAVLVEDWGKSHED